MAGFRHISSRLIVWTLGGAALALFALGWYQQRQARLMVLAQAEARAAAITASIREELQGVLRAVETSVRLTAARVEEGPVKPAVLEDQLRDMLVTNPRIYGTTAAFEAFATPAGEGRFAPYLFRQPGGFGHADLATPEYAYWDQPWYRQPLARGTAGWTEPYFDEGAGDTLMVTYSLPFRRPATDPAKIAGVVTADVALGWLKRVTEDNRPGQTGFIILFSEAGRLITHPRTELIQKETLTGLADKNQQPELAFMGREVAAGRSGSISYDSRIFRSRIRVDYRPVDVGGWGIMVGYEEEEFLAPVAAAGRVVFGSAIATLLLLAGIIVLISRRITRPLQELADTADQIALGNLAVAIAPPRTRDEVGHLAAAFGRMRDELQRHIAELTAATAARQKLESELAIAQLIQRTMLPAPRHTARGALTAHLAARVVPAKAVGGDLYVYFPLGADRLGFAVGDVSDKGVPAALFMARTLTLLRTIGREVGEPGEILARVNAELFPDNDECMFVTLFCGVLDLATGALACASAGHESPLVMSTAGAWEFWDIPTGAPLGLAADFSAPVSRRILAPGEQLLLYTDGVTDAANPAGKLLTSDGLLQLLRAFAPLPPELADELLQRVQAFAAGADQTDDITVFTLRLE